MTLSSETPQVSIVIPCFNQGIYLDDSISSVLSQIFQSFEIIIINDGSTDAFTNSYLQNLEHHKITIYNTVNQGRAITRNYGVSNSKGKYILLLDADDKIERTYLEKAVQVLDQNDFIGIVTCQAKFFGSKNHLWQLPNFEFPKILVDNSLFITSLFRKSDWERTNGFNPNMTYGWEDHDFWISMIELGIGVHKIPEVLFFYRQHSESNIANMTREHQIFLYRKMFDNHRELYIKHIDILFEIIVDFRLSQLWKSSSIWLNFVSFLRMIISKTKKFIAKSDSQEGQLISPADMKILEAYSQMSHISKPTILHNLIQSIAIDYDTDT